MKRVIIALASIIIAVSTLQAQAYTIQDNYWGADDHGGKYGGDIIANVGNEKAFAIDSLSANVNGSELKVKINGTFFNPQVGNKEGVTLGDLFISTNGWHPTGSAADHYLNDSYANGGGEAWEYAFVLNNRNRTVGTKGGSFNVYQVPKDKNGKNKNIIQTYVGPGYIWRNGQEWELNTACLKSIASGSWSLALDKNSITFDLANFSNYFNDSNINDWGYHYAMSCGNDTFEGGAPPVPEPGTFLLLGVGLIGLAGYRRLRK